MKAYFRLRLHSIRVLGTRRPQAWGFLFMLWLLGATAGCHTTDPSSLALAEAAAAPESVRLHAGDTVQVTFPGAPSMNTSQRIRIDGFIAMPLVGDVPAAGKTPVELQADLAKRYDPHLQNKEVVVIVGTSSATVFV